MAKIQDIRNIVFVGHGGAGKTTLVEAILNKTDMTNRLGTVEEKNTVSDFDEEEKERGNSIQSAITFAEHEGVHYNIIDTPGYPEFIGPALQSIPAAEAAVVVVSAAAGIEVNTRKLFRAAENMGKPRIIVINKMDSDTADLSELVGAIQETFGTQCKCANLPNAGGDGVIDCISNDSGDSPVMSVADANTEFFESVIEADDELMEAYLGGETVSPEKIAEVMVKATMEGTIIPIVFTNAKDVVGVDELINLIKTCVPSPDNAGPAKLIEGEEEKDVAVDPSGPFAGQVFRVAFDPRSNMKYASVRVFSGKIDSNTQLYINDNKKPVRPGHPLVMQGAETHETEAISAGEIGTLPKIDELKVGDLVHEGDFAGTFKMPKFPKPMFSLALEPASRGDEAKISAALDKLTDEDVCFTVGMDPQTKERVISGLGDLHLRVMLSKMENRYKVGVNTKQPKIPYKETITAKGDGHYRHKKQTGGAGQFGEVYLRVEPGVRDQDPPMEYSWDIFGGSIPGQFEPAIVKGVNEVMENGPVAGFPMQDIKVSIYDGKHHPVDSKEVAFKAAGKGAFIDAVKKARPVLLEPIVDMEVTVPSENMGDITGDLSSRRGRVQGQEVIPGGMMIIRAQVPLSEVTQYNSQLKSVTGGQGSYSMELSHYEPTPPNVQQQVIAQYQAEQEEEESK
ncbi:Elongation factor G [Anaerohalosphaera lusitana]|uniref:Elongation factor G n=1 Tax=Anaerohalosphaera lusitana TaxID=1936003 RepID=A0A1U9NL17_9BACT|nr:elongation factor G [Anaerohalosphaera lusitana]AQT68631.1 Elongation factor G [Anaerohalosphaera lusitana]